MNGITVPDGIGNVLNPSEVSRKSIEDMKETAFNQDQLKVLEYMISQGGGGGGLPDPSQANMYDMLVVDEVYDEATDTYNNAWLLRPAPVFPVLYTINRGPGGRYGTYYSYFTYDGLLDYMRRQEQLPVFRDATDYCYYYCGKSQGPDEHFYDLMCVEVGGLKVVRFVDNEDPDASASRKAIGHVVYRTDLTPVSDQ